MRSLDLLWAGLRGDPSLLPTLTICGPEHVLPSTFGVTSFAAATIGVATLAASELLQARTGEVRRVEIDTAEACAAFRSEALFEPIGWERPPTWDPIAGDYRASDRWIRLHTNYASHRGAALAVLGTAADRDAVASAVARWEAARLESAIVEAGGCAAVMYSRDEWRAHPHGAATIEEEPIALEDDGLCASTPRELGRTEARPLEGVRVLDLTRVIAGPVCTRFLAAHGADVLRIDPPGFEEVPAILPESTSGKRCAFLALDTVEGAARLDALLSQADVLVHGLRPGALDRLGFDHARLRARNPALVIVTLDAYGWRGPWSGRRGFDSLVQMSAGVAAAGLGDRSRGDRPSPLPAQALDHGIGYLLAAGVCRALTLRVKDARVATVRGALIGAANHLFAIDRGDPAVTPPSFAELLERTDTWWGPARRVRVPGSIEGCERAVWTRAPGPLGAHPASF